MTNGIRRAQDALGRIRPDFGMFGLFGRTLEQTLTLPEASELNLCPCRPKIRTRRYAA